MRFQEGWSKVSLSQILELLYGKSLPKSAREDGSYPVYGSNGTVGYHSEFAVTGPGIIVGRKGSCGEVHYCDSDFWPIDTTYYVNLKRNDNLRFVAYLLSSLGLNQMNSHSTIPGLNRERVYRLSFPLPPLSEQKKIAAVLLKLQRAIEAQERIIQSLRDLKKSTMQHLFTRGLRGEKTKMTEIGEIPESWDVVRLEDVCSFLSGGTPRKSHSEFWKGTVPWVSPKDMKKPRLKDAKDHITEEALNSGSCLAPVRSIFIVVRGMILMKDVPIALTEVPMAFNQDMKAIIPNKQYDPEFLFYALQAFKHLLFQKVGRSAHGTRTIISTTLSEFKVPRPCMSEQIQIAASLRIAEKNTAICESRKACLQSLFKTTLNNLMTGAIRVADIDIDVREVEG